jgi:tRNA pseudouridine55 synthase
MKKIMLINKQIGLTPLDVIKRLRITQPELAHETIGYAGRLDPMAEGLLLLLVGDENKKRKTYESLAKVYTLQMLLGITTDTYDTLGRIKAVTPNLTISQKTLTPILSSFIGEQEQSYPPYSSVHVNGKPLFYWARENKLHTITIPKKRITISAITIKEITNLQTATLVSEAVHRTHIVSGEFRQTQIRSDWEHFVQHYPSQLWPIVTLQVSCSSGTYIRQLATDIGKHLGAPAMAYRIIREAVGSFSLSDAVTLT